MTGPTRVMLLALLGGGLAAPASSQGLAVPPHQDAHSPTGVSYASGAFTYNARDLSIGGEGAQGLTLDRTYMSNVLSDAFGGHGWTHNWSGRIVPHIIPPPMADQPWTPDQEPWVFDVVVGARSIAFFGGSSWPPRTGGPVGTYTPVAATGASLVFTGTTAANGRYVFTDSDGTVVNFPLGAVIDRIQDWTYPDGTRLDFGYANGRLSSVISNRGYALLFERPNGTPLTKVCAVNMTQHAVGPASTCPAGVQTVTYSYLMGTAYPNQRLLTGATDPNNQTTSYGYVNPDRLGCITLPGQQVCQILNSYTLCYDWNPTYNRMDHKGEYVTSQTTGDNQVYSYVYAFVSSQDPPTCESTVSSDTRLRLNGLQITRVVPGPDNLPLRIEDGLNRATEMQYLATGDSLETDIVGPSLVTFPALNSISFEYDSRGNLTRRVVHAVPGAVPALANIETSAAFPTTCTDRMTCNRPTTVTDERNNVTDYSYDAAHGGVLTETGPAVNGVRPQTRHSYAQRHAWILPATGGGYVQAATPVWLRTASSMCRTSAASGNPAAPCATAGDEVLTQYDYGPNSGPNNLLLRGQVVTADGVSLRTCYGYDRQGNRISETESSATATSCP